MQVLIHGPRRVQTDNVTVREVRLGQGQKATVILEQGRIKRIVSDSGLVSLGNAAPQRSMPFDMMVAGLTETCIVRHSAMVNLPDHAHIPVASKATCGIDWRGGHCCCQDNACTQLMHLTWALQVLLM